MLDHLASRGINEPDRYHLYYDEEVACFLLGNFSRQFVGYQQYRPSADKTRKNDPKLGRYYTFCRDRVGVWGLETWTFNRHVLFITEGIFDSVKLHNQGLPAIAALANNPKHIRPWLNIIRQQRVLIGVCDNDEAGTKLSNSVDISLTLKGSKDLGDMTNDEVREYLWNEKKLSFLTLTEPSQT